VAHNGRPALPCLCSYQPGRARWQALTVPLRAWLSAARPIPTGSAAFYRMDAQPRPVCPRVRHGRVRLLRGDGASGGQTSQGWFFGFQLHLLRPLDGRMVKLVRTPGPGDERAPVLTLRDGVEGAMTWGD
jgi:Transposase DDE domain